MPKPLHRQQDDLRGADLFHAVGDLRDDQRIGEERKMIAMLFHRAERQYEDAVAERGEFGPVDIG
jgi:hypothetical protein